MYPAGERRGREAEIGKAGGAGSSRRAAAGWQLAEAVRFFESETAEPIVGDEAALVKARALEGPVGAKVLARAEALAVAPDLTRALADLRSVLRGVALASAAIAAFAGAATARTAFASADGTLVNVFWLLAGLLGLHVASFAAWMVLMLSRPRRAGGGLMGIAVLWLWRQAGQRIGAGPYRLAALRALATRWGQGGAGRWLASALSHGLWTAYLLGALAMTLALLSAQSYVFVWETTILDAADYVWLTDALAMLPAALGIAMPDRAAVLAARWPGAPEADHAVLWSSLLVWSILLYGLLVRLGALAISMVLARRAGRGAPDLADPYYARLATLLSPMVAAVRVVDGDGDAAAVPETAPDLGPLPPPPPAGAVYLLGWEVDLPEAGWPPPGVPPQAVDLGRRDGRGDLDEAVAKLTGSADTLARLVVVLDLRQTPDRGVTAVLSTLHAAAQGRLAIAFSGAGALEDRMPAGDAETRIADWVAAALAAGVLADHMAAIDLLRPTDESRQRLARLLGAGT